MHPREQSRLIALLEAWASDNLQADENSMIVKSALVLVLKFYLTVDRQKKYSLLWALLGLLLGCSVLTSPALFVSTFRAMVADHSPRIVLPLSAVVTHSWPGRRFGFLALPDSIHQRFPR